MTELQICKCKHLNYAHRHERKIGLTAQAGCPCWECDCKSYKKAYNVNNCYYDGIHLAHPDLVSLHLVAEALGIKRCHFDHNPKHPHYDVPLFRKTIVSHICLVVSTKELIRKCYRVKCTKCKVITKTYPVTYSDKAEYLCEDCLETKYPIYSQHEWNNWNCISKSQ